MTTPNQNNVTTENIEGLGGDEDASWGDYPIDTVLIRHENRTIHDVLRRIDQGSFIMNPDFQRDFIWPDDKQSKLIESLLMRIPLPVFYLAEDTQGRMVVVDGLQRLSTFRRFVSDELQLKLPFQSELNRKRFSDLSAKLQNRIEDSNLVLYVIDAKVPERARLDIFERVNSGIPLTRQQMRNSLYMGKGTQFVRTEAGTKLFAEATGRSLRSTTMRDREFVNRFCAFRLIPIEEYRGDMDEYLAEALRRMNKLSDNDLNEISVAFRRSLTNNFEVFGKHAFRKHSQGQTGRSVINASLWDVMTIAFADRSEHFVVSRSPLLRAAFLGLMDDAEFIESITYSTNDARRVKRRFASALKTFGELFNANSD